MRKSYFVANCRIRYNNIYFLVSISIIAINLLLFLALFTNCIKLYEWHNLLIIT